MIDRIEFDDLELGDSIVIRAKVDGIRYRVVGRFHGFERSQGSWCLIIRREDGQLEQIRTRYVRKVYRKQETSYE